MPVKIKTTLRYLVRHKSMFDMYEVGEELYFGKYDRLHGIIVGKYLSKDNLIIKIKLMP